MKDLYKVAKGLSQEEMTLVNNISALISELKSASGVQAGMENRDGQPPIENPEQISEKAEPSPSDKKGEGEPSPSDKTEKSEAPSPSPSPSTTVKKDEVNTESDVATARDKPEDRMLDALSEVDVENVDEVKKAVKLIRDMKEIRTMKSRSLTPLASAMVELTQVVKSIVNEQNQTQLALKNILDGMGVTQQMSIVQKSESDHRPIVDNDNVAMSKVIKGLLKEVVKNEGVKIENRVGDNTSIAIDNVQKSLELMKGMIPQASKKFG
jgi:hypothetical protein